jgi:integrase/recombinase XerD
MIMGRCSRVRVIGPLAPYVAGFRRSLAEQGYTPYSIYDQLLLMAHVSRWLVGEGLDGIDLTVARVGQFLRVRRAGGYAQPVSMCGMLALLGYLRGLGVAPGPEPDVADTPVGVLLERYRVYLVEERGLSTSSSVRHYLDVAGAFLVHRSITVEVDLAGLTSADVTEFVLSESRRRTVGYAKSIASRLRSLLRFLHVEGLTTSALDMSVPSVAGWRLTVLPQAIDATDVACLLTSCDRRSRIGRRDFAILTVLARLGLRAGEVAALRLDDIDWRLQRGRPRCACPAVFTRILAPHRALSDRAVSGVVRHACERAGLPPVGAHRLRHWVATQTLRAGGNLVEVGQLLRHHSLTATAVNAKVDRRALSAVVQPWPGGAA